jgi:NAD(P) transhydrogenase subunit alpha
MRVAVPRETAPGERRVALVPETVSKLRDDGFAIRVEREAGAAAGFPDEEYAEAGAELVDAQALPGDVEGIVRVAPPSPDEVGALASGTVLVGFLNPLADADGVARLRDRGIVAFAMESIPRITRAQPMDALSSQATVSGYKAVLLAADRVPKLFPMLMTAAGTIAPVRALVIGAGVAGLQAIATARRLGAVVPRAGRQSRGDRRRVRDRAHAGAAGPAAGGARGADPRLRRRRHHGGRSRASRTEAHPGLGGRTHAAGLCRRGRRRRDGRQL